MSFEEAAVSSESVTACQRTQTSHAHIVITRSNVSKHVKVVHEKRRDFKCSMCNHAASKKTNLSQHVKSVHLRVRDQECEKCDFKCSHKAVLVRHMKEVHENIRDHECPKCDMKFSRSLILVAHIERIHERGKKTVRENTKENIPDRSDYITETICQICGFKSSKVSELARHVMEQCVTEH